MSAQSQLVLVTGVSGFLGSHVVDQLVKEGSGVRGIVRSAKVAKVQEAFDAAYGTGRVEIVGTDDLVEGDFTSALKGATAVIHVASPMSNLEDAESSLRIAIDGTINIVRQALKAGVKKFSFAGSIAAAFDPANPKQTLTEKDWNPFTREDALDGTRGVFYVYAACKVLAEKAVWAIAEENSDISVTTINSPYFIGPYTPGYRISPGDLHALNNNLLIYNLLIPDSKATTAATGFIDVRDVAGALVAGIKTPGRNRVLLTGDWFEYKDAVEHIASARPELKDRLPNITPTGQKQGIIDNANAQKVLGIPPARPWKESVIDIIDALIKLEKDWTNQGIDIEITLKKDDRIVR